MSPRAVLLFLLLLAAPLAGCLQPAKDFYAFDPSPQYKNPGVFEGNYTFGTGSTVLRAGLLHAGKPEVVHLRSNTPAYPDPASGTSDATVYITMAVWRPENVTVPLPVLVDAGPYYESASCVGYEETGLQAPLDKGRCLAWHNGTIDQASQIVPFLLRNYLPRGYAVAQVAVRGTGTSGGCMDLFGPDEMSDLDQAITYLGTQPWSNGNVGMIGASYDGGTQWEAAATGNPHLKTIVPTASLPDLYGLMWHNGSAETRGATLHDTTYYPFGFSAEFPYDQLPASVPDPTLPSQSPVQHVPHPTVADPYAGSSGTAGGRDPYQDRQNLLCPEVARGAVVAKGSEETGSRLAEASDYWTVRDHRQAVLDHYKGSIFLIHGLQDWNVDPHSTIPYNQQLRAKGIEMKEWFGQWGHAFPDSTCAQTPAQITLPCRLDFAEVLGRWYDHYLKGNTTQDLGPAVQVQDDIGFWRNADAFPTPTASWMDLTLTADGKLSAGSDATETTATLQPGTQATAGNVLAFKSDLLADDLRFSGLPQLRLPFQVQGPGGQLGAWLFDESANGSALAFEWGALNGAFYPDPANPIVAHAQMDLRYYQGGETMQPPAAGQRALAKVEFEPADVLVPKGHRLVLWVFQGHYDDHQSTRVASPVQVFLGKEAQLRLPVIQVDAKTIFPVPGVPLPDRDLLWHRMVQVPAAPPTT